MKHKILSPYLAAITTILALLSISFSASASTVVFSNNGLEFSASVTRITPESTKSLSGGMFDLTQIGGTYTPSLMANNPSDVAKFSAFCLEPNVSIQAGSTYNITGLETASMYSPFASGTGGIGTVKADHIRELMYQVYPVFGVALSNLDALAIQIALWEIVREEAPGSYSVSSGGVSFTGNDPASNQAQTWLDTYVGKGGPKLDNLAALTMNGGQDLLVQTVPIPAAVWLFGSAFIGLIGIGRRRKN